MLDITLNIHVFMLIELNDWLNIWKGYKFYTEQFVVIHEDFPLLGDRISFYCLFFKFVFGVLLACV